MSQMRIGIGLAAAVAVASLCGLAAGADQAPGAKKKILFFSPSFGFRHSVVTRPMTGQLSYAEKMLKEMAGRSGYEVYFSQDFHDLDNPGAYKQFDAIVFYTTGNPPINREGLLKYVRDGGALIGIHTATDTFHSDGNCGPKWPEYTHLIGAAFRTHGPGHDAIVIKVEDPNNPATKMIKQGWEIRDEIYLFREFSRDNCHVLLSVNTERTSDKSLAAHNMTRGEDCPIAWTRTEGKGRVFYTSLGHLEDVWANPLWQQHVLGGIAWAMEK
jgi:type 1 glutamine amidotransferase